VASQGRVTSPAIDGAGELPTIRRIASFSHRADVTWSAGGRCFASDGVTSCAPRQDHSHAPKYYRGHFWGRFILRLEPVLTHFMFF
jgi:hypothetical protein